METVFFLALVIVVYALARIGVDLYFKNRSTAWKKRSPLLGVVQPPTKSQKKKEQK
jgi:hypothetical protein